MSLINRVAISFAAVLCLLPLAGAAMVWGQLPDPIAVSYDADLNPTSWMSMPLVIIGLPIAMCILAICVGELGRWRARCGESSTLLYAAMWVSPMISVAFSAYCVIGAIVSNPNINAFGFLAVGVVLIAAGYTLIRLRANTKFGIRTPWSLLTRENWERTNRVGGACFMLAGVAIAIIGIALMFREMSTQTATMAILVAVVLAVIIPTLSSYLTRNLK